MFWRSNVNKIKFEIFKKFLIFIAIYFDSNGIDQII